MNGYYKNKIVFAYQTLKGENLEKIKKVFLNYF